MNKWGSGEDIEEEERLKRIFLCLHMALVPIDKTISAAVVV